MADLITRVYNNFRGVDFRGEEINLIRSPDSKNMWKDYKETESIRTRPEFVKVDGFIGDGSVYGVWFFKAFTIVHQGTQLYLYKNGVWELTMAGMYEAESTAFVYNDIFYFLGSGEYLWLDTARKDLREVANNTSSKNPAYIPTTTIGRKPMGGGTKYEDVNMLSAWRKNSFLSDGASFSYFLDVMNIDEGEDVYVYVNGERIDCNFEDKEEYDEEKDEYITIGRGFDYDENGDEVDFFKVYYAEGKIVFVNTPPPAPLTDGQDNVVIEFKKTVPEYEDVIENCTMAQVFDNRVFFSGNPDHPNMVWNCSLNDPTYVSDLDYYKEGMDNAAVKGLVAGNNALWVFREPSDANTTVFYHTPALDDEYGKIYPSAHSSITTGCIGKAINFNDDIVFFSERGMEGISGDVTTEQIIAHRSTLVDRKLTAEPEYKNMVLAEWEGYLFIFIGNKVYLADSRAMYQNENHMEYEFFYWELEHNVHCATVKDGVLYIGTDDGVYTLTDMEADVESYWVTPLDKFKNPNKLKTTNKRGCVAEATGDISLYAKLEDTDFELIGTYNNVTDYFVSRIKRKKFKDIQLKFHSNTRFSLETVVLECFVGGYIKR